MAPYLEGVLVSGELARLSQKWDSFTVRRVRASGEKPLHWFGSSKRDFLDFPMPVQGDMGNALGIAQFGGTAPSAKPWKGLGSGVLEIVESHDGNHEEQHGKSKR